MKITRALVLALVLVAPLVGGEKNKADKVSPHPKMKSIDSHAHVFTRAAPGLFDLLKRLDLLLVNICVLDASTPDTADLARQRSVARTVSRESQGRIPWVTSFDSSLWEKPTFAEDVIKRLQEDFTDGAIGVKVYKVIGMELKSKAGKYLLPDDPAFGPILEFIATKNKTLIAHLAEPDQAWKPLDPNDLHYPYYRDYPHYHMFRFPDRPSKEAILEARDRLLERNPKLRVVGAHLGSMEADVDQIAIRLERYPNFAVDTAARVPSLMIQPREKVRAFMIKYEDRVLYATDNALRSTADPQQVMRLWEEEYTRDWKYFATDEIVAFQGRTTRGLALPQPVLRKFFRDNAARWIPGITIGTR